MDASNRRNTREFSEEPASHWAPEIDNFADNLASFLPNQGSPRILWIWRLTRHWGWARQ